MSSSLEQSSSGSAHPYEDDFTQYRSLSASAVVSLLFGVLSVAAMLPDYWVPKAVPVVGMALAIAAIFRIRSHADELTGRRFAIVGLALSTFFLVAGSGFSAYTQIAEVPEGCTRISYEQLKPTEDRPYSAPESAKVLDGERVFIKGYMFPTDHDSGITRFVLCRDSGDCCFGGNPPLSDMIFVRLKDPLQARFNGRLRHLAGTFRVAGSVQSDVKKQVLYALDADYIR